MSVSARWLGVGALLLAPSLGWANGLQFRSSYSCYYYYPTISYSVMCVEPAYVLPACSKPQQQMLPAPRKYAQPAPAGPSGKPLPTKTTEPPPAGPSGKPVPPAAVKESRSYFSAYAVAPRGTEQAQAERCKVGFWNLSDRDVTLEVDGKKYPLPRGKSVAVELPRTFAWKVDNRDLQKEKVAATDSAIEIVIRR